MVGDKKVSIIIPLYNRKHLIARCVESVCRQTYRNLEIIVVDDGSTDGCEEILESLKKADERIIIIRKENGGVSSARNCGLDAATGDYVQFVDSDDAIVADAVELAVTEMENQKLDSVGFPCCTDMNFTVESFPRVVERYSVWRGGDALAELLRMRHQCEVWSKLYKRELIGEKRFPEGVFMGEDFIFNVAYFSSVRSFSFLKNVCYLYNNMEGESLAKRYDNRGISDLHAQWDAVQPYMRSAGLASRQLLLRYFWGCYIGYVRKLCLLAPLSYISQVRVLQEWGHDAMVQQLPADCCLKAWDCFFLKHRCFFLLPLVVRLAHWKRSKLA